MIGRSNTSKWWRERPGLQISTNKSYLECVTLRLMFVSSQITTVHRKDFVKTATSAVHITEVITYIRVDRTDWGQFHHIMNLLRTFRQTCCYKLLTTCTQHNQSGSQSIDQLIDWLADQWMDGLIDRDRSIDRSINQWVSEWVSE